MIRTFLTLFLLTHCLLFPMRLLADDVCSEAGEAWRSKHVYDIEMRRKRVKVRETLLELIAESDQIDLKMADIKEAKLSATYEERVLLDEQYMVLSDERDEIYEEVKTHQERYSDLSRERGGKKIELLLKELGLKSRCATNEPLNKKLNAVSIDINKKGLLSGTKLAKFNALRAEREATLLSLNTEIKKYNGEIKARLNKYNNLEDEIKNIIILENDLDNKRDVEQEEMYKEVEKWYELIDSEKEKLSKLSEQILKITEELK